MTSDQVGKLDLVEAEILRHKLVAIAQEMGLQLSMTSQSSEINQDRDFGCAIAGPKGRVVATDNASQLGALAMTTAAVRQHFRFSMKEGDVIVVNAPEFGGVRSVDLAVIAPVFIAGKMLGYFTVRGRMPDFGGAVAGGFNPTATELLAEAVPLTPIKLHREGKVVRDVETMLLLNCRHPDRLRQLIDTMLAAIAIGQRRVGELVDGYQQTSVQHAMEYSPEYVTRRLRSEFAKWREGEFWGEAVMDHNGAGGPGPKVRVKATVSGDQVTLDFSESDAEVATFANSTRTNTVGMVAATVLSGVSRDIPPNGGVLDALTIVTKPGTIVDPLRTSPCGWGAQHSGAEIALATSRALRQAAGPVYGEIAGPSLLALCRPVEERAAMSALHSWCVPGSSAYEGVDGWGRPSLLSRSVIPSVEEWEAHDDVRVSYFEYVTDTAGAGKWRGAPAVRAVLAVPGERALTLCCMGRKNRSIGVSGGQAGAGASIRFNVNGEAVDAPDVLVEALVTVGHLEIVSASGSGFGDPKERNPQAVYDDYCDGLISTSAAEAVYKVCFARDGSGVDLETTRQWRRT